MKKLFGGIDLTWKKLIIYAIIAGIFTGIMALIPIFNETSFRDIAVYFEWWILFGILIIANSKSPKDSALKCSIFFLISQPLVYLVQVPFNWRGWGLFIYYKYWFIWTLACIPMGFIGYYINKKNVLSVIILLPILLLLSIEGLSFFSAMMNDFPHHLLSFITCFLIIIFVVINLFDKTKLKIITLCIVAIFNILYFYKGEIVDAKYETYRTIDNFDINFVGQIRVVSFSGENEGDVEVGASEEDLHSIKVSGRKNSKYTFTICDESDAEYSFEYYYDNKSKSIVLNKIPNND